MPENEVVFKKDCKSVREKLQSEGAVKGAVLEHKESRKVYYYKYTTKSDNVEGVRVHRNEIFNEFIYGPVYKLLLGERAPNIVLILSDDDEIGLGSEEIIDFKRVGDPENKSMDFLNVEFNGFEEIMAALIFMGDHDFNKGNIGFVKKQNTFSMCKIDHGDSGSNSYENRSSLRSKFWESYEYHGYSEFKFNLHNFRVALSKVIKVSLDDIVTIINARLQVLKDNGVDCSAFEKKNYREYFFKHLELMNGLLQDLDVIEKVDIPNKDKFLCTSWFKVIQGQDPILWAMSKKYKIEAQNPLEWAIKNQCLISDVDPIEWALEHAPKVDQIPVLDWAIGNNITISGQHVVALAIQKQVMIQGQEAIAWAGTQSKKINGTDLFAYLFSKKITIDGMLFYHKLLTSSIKVDGKDPIEWVVDNRSIIGNSFKLLSVSTLVKLSTNETVLAWMLKNKPTYTLGNETVEVLKYAANKRAKIDKKPVSEWVKEQNFTIAGQGGDAENQTQLSEEVAGDTNTALPMATLADVKANAAALNIPIEYGDISGENLIILDSDSDKDRLYPEGARVVYQNKQQGTPSCSDNALFSAMKLIELGKTPFLLKVGKHVVVAFHDNQDADLILEQMDLVDLEEKTSLHQSYLDAMNGVNSNQPDVISTFEDNDLSIEEDKISWEFIINMILDKLKPLDSSIEVKQAILASLLEAFEAQMPETNFPFPYRPGFDPDDFALNGGGEFKASDDSVAILGDNNTNTTGFSEM